MVALLPPPSSPTMRSRVRSFVCASIDSQLQETKADKIRARELRSDGAILHPRRRRGFQMSNNVNMWSDDVHRRELRGGGSFLSTAGSFTLAGGNRAGFG